MLVAIGSPTVITVPPWELALPRQVVLKARGHVVAILGSYLVGLGCLDPDVRVSGI